MLWKGRFGVEYINRHRNCSDLVEIRSWTVIPCFGHSLMLLAAIADQHPILPYVRPSGPEQKIIEGTIWSQTHWSASKLMGFGRNAKFASNSTFPALLDATCSYSASAQCLRSNFTFVKNFTWRWNFKIWCWNLLIRQWNLSIRLMRNSCKYHQGVPETLNYWQISHFDRIPPISTRINAFGSKSSPFSFFPVPTAKKLAKWTVSKTPKMDKNPGRRHRP